MSCHVNQDFAQYGKPWGRHGPCWLSCPAAAGHRSARLGRGHFGFRAEVRKGGVKLSSFIFGCCCCCCCCCWWCSWCSWCSYVFLCVLGVLAVMCSWVFPLFLFFFLLLLFLLRLLITCNQTRCSLDPLWWCSRGIVVVVVEGKFIPSSGSNVHKLAIQAIHWKSKTQSF